MFKSMVIPHCFGATFREIYLVNQFATNFSLFSLLLNERNGASNEG